MKIVRWVLFLPVALVVFGVAQTITAGVAARFSWFWGLSASLIACGVIAIFSCLSIRIAPNPKIGATIALTLFLLFELIALVASIQELSAIGIVIRLCTDAFIVFGAVAAAQIKEL